MLTACYDHCIMMAFNFLKGLLCERYVHLLLHRFRSDQRLMVTLLVGMGGRQDVFVVKTSNNLKNLKNRQTLILRWRKRKCGGLSVHILFAARITCW